MPPNKEKSLLVEREITSKLNAEGFMETISQFLSEQIGIQISVNGYSSGSIRLHCKLSDYADIDDIRDMCDSGVLGNILQNILVSSDMINKHGVQFICIDVSMDEKSYDEILQFLQGKMLESFRFVIFIVGSSFNKRVSLCGHQYVWKI